MRCKTCNQRHLLVLHKVNERVPGKVENAESTLATTSCLMNTASEVLFADRPPGGRKVLLKVSKVILSHGNQVMETYAILDDGSERTILLQGAAKQLGLKGQPEDLTLRTVRQELHVLHEGICFLYNIFCITTQQDLPDPRCVHGSAIGPVSTDPASWYPTKEVSPSKGTTATAHKPSSAYDPHWF
ncbi:hypothetical protein DPEC_G00069850 [Dallia pectoralis]|uniref:Uncharacterized protein n=1 Tax=Dallia pectoralis TaxID=75939 RepID=A0ACC2H2R6_DALPE|nr:hypothetical protein DPEC_G00069850 [Dallia pectoralis]